MICFNSQIVDDCLCERSLTKLQKNKQFSCIEKINEIFGHGERIIYGVALHITKAMFLQQYLSETRACFSPRANAGPGGLSCRKKSISHHRVGPSENNEGWTLIGLIPKLIFSPVILSLISYLYLSHTKNANFKIQSTVDLKHLQSSLWSYNPKFEIWGRSDQQLLRYYTFDI